MTGKERISAVVNGDAVDRPPVGFWRHFYLSEQQPEDLADKLLSYQSEYNWDFMVVTARTSYYGEAWGNEYVYGEDDDTAPSQLTTRITSPESFGELDVLDPEDDVLGGHLTCLRWIHRKGQKGVPYLMTIHTPLAIADFLVGSTERTIDIMRRSPDSLKKGLECIAVTMASFAGACIRSGGASGIMLITPDWATADVISLEEYSEFGRPFDLIVLDSVQNAEFNVLQVSGSGCMSERFLDYPANALNWDSMDEANPDLASISAMCDKVLLGGIDHRRTLRGDRPGDVVAEAKSAVETMKGRRLIVGPGADYAPGVPEANLKAMSDWARDIESS